MKIENTRLPMSGRPVDFNVKGRTFTWNPDTKVVSRKATTEHVLTYLWPYSWSTVKKEIRGLIALKQIE